MQAPTTLAGTSFSTAQSNVTKSKEQILIQSSGAMIAVIVLGVIIILAIVLLILKTYNRHTHVSRMLGTSSKSRQKSTSTAFSHQSGVPMAHLGISSVSGSVAGPQFPLRRRSGSPSENGFHLPRAELSDTQRNNDNASDRGGGSTVVTVHDALSLGYT